MERRNISWKGRSFNQIVARLKQNINSTVPANAFAAQPIRHYRKEIGNIDVCSRTKISLDDFMMPGGTIVNTQSTRQTNNVEVAEFGLTMNKTERPTTSCDTVACSKQADARRRVRSSGNVKRVFSQSKNNDKYYTSSNEYLVSRNLTIAQNQYSYVRFGDSTVEPGSNNSLSNVYSPAGINHCAKVNISGFSVSPLFSYQWIDGTDHDFTIPNGFYDLGELNSVFQNVMITRIQYYTNMVSGKKEFAMNFVYDVRTDRIQIQCKAVSSASFPPEKYTTPIGGVTLNIYVTVPVIHILNNSFQQIIGVNSGYYPCGLDGDHSIDGAHITLLSYPPGNPSGYYLQPDQPPQTPDNNIFTTDQNFTGLISPKIGTPYVPLYYKPSNSKFATQGSVDSSSRLTRLKYDTITQSASSFTTAFGRQTANALAYGVPGPGYSLKERVGYTNSCRPTANASTQQMMKCTTTKIRGG